MAPVDRGVVPDGRLGADAVRVESRDERLVVRVEIRESSARGESHAPGHTSQVPLSCTTSPSSSMRPPDAEVLHDVPVDRALVEAADRRVALAEREVDRAVDLLVEEDVLHEPRDAGVAADAELADATSALVAVEDRVEQLLALRGCGVDDAALLELEPDSLELVTLVDSGVLGERDHAFGRVLDGREEELAPRHVLAPVVHLAVPVCEADREVGTPADDADLGSSVEPIGIAAHAFALGIPVEQARVEQRVRQLCQREAGLLGKRVRRVLAADPRDLGGHRPPVEDVRRRLDEGETLGGDVSLRAGVLGGVERDARVHPVAGEAVDLGQLGEERFWRGSGPVDVDRPERRPAQSHDRVRAAACDQPLELLDQRARERGGADEDLPAGLHVEAALDEKLCVALDARVLH